MEVRRQFDTQVRLSVQNGSNGRDLLGPAIAVFLHRQKCFLKNTQNLPFFEVRVSNLPL